MANTLDYNTSRSDANFTFVRHLIVDVVNPVLYPSIDTILCIMLTMPVTSATAERSFSVLRQLKTYVRSTMNNDRLSSLALVHIHRDFSVDLDKVMEKFVSANTRKTDLGNYK
jgi:hypothetical protein